MGRFLRFLTSAMHREPGTGTRQRRALGRSPYHRRPMCEALETRTLLSVGLAGGVAGTGETVADLPVAAVQSVSSAISQDQAAYHATSAAAGVINPANTINPVTQTAKVSASDGAANSDFGSSVSASGSAMVVGASGDTNGAVHVFGTAISVATNVTSVSTTAAANSIVTVGGTVPVTVAFSQAVDVSGTPQLTLNDGGVANYSGGSGTSTLTFTYVVKAGQGTTDLDDASNGALVLNGGSIQDLAGNAAVLTLPTTGTDGLAVQNIVIDALPPAVTGVSLIGGTTVTITGTDFMGVTAVDFGAVAASGFTVNSATQITATSPAGTGTVNVTVRTLAGISGISSADQFSYAAFTLAGLISDSFATGQTIPIQWTAANVPSGSTISLAYDTTWIEIDGVGAANGSGTYDWNTTGVAVGTYYLDGYLYTPSSGTAVTSHLATSFMVTAAAPAFTLIAPAAETFPSGQTVSIQWTAADFPSGSTISLACESTNIPNIHSGPVWIEIDGVSASNGIGSYSWNTTGLAAATYCMYGYMYMPSTATAVVSTLTTSFTVTSAPTFAISSPASGSYSAGQPISIPWTAANVPSGSTISLAYDTTSTWGNPTWIEIDGVSAASGNGSYNWNTAGLAAGTYYLDGYLYTPLSGTAVMSHLTTSFTVTTTPGFTLSNSALGTFVAGQTETIQWTASSVPAGSLISLAYDTTSTWGNPKWIEIDEVAAANGSVAYTWNTTGLAAGTYYLDGYMYTPLTGTAVLSHLTTSFTVTTPTAAPSFTLSSPAFHGCVSGQTIPIQWTAGSVPAGSTISLAYDTTSDWGNPKWIEIDGVAAANGSGSYDWTTTGLADGTYYLDGYMYTPSTTSAVLSIVTTSFTVSG